MKPISLSLSFFRSLSLSVLLAGVATSPSIAEDQLHRRLIVRGRDVSMEVPERQRLVARDGQRRTNVDRQGYALRPRGRSGYARVRIP